MSDKVVKKSKVGTDNLLVKGRPKGTGSLTPMAKEFIDAIYLEGLPYNIAYKQAGYKSPYHLKRAQEILAVPAAVEYANRLQNDDTAKLQASKTYLVKNLVDRLEKCKDSDAVNIIKQISQMLGYQVQKDDEVQVNNKLEIIWAPLINFEEGVK